MSVLPTDGLGAWAELPFFANEIADVEDRLAGTPFLPPAALVFDALRRCPPEATRVLILGQDPYPTPGHANGLAFSVHTGTRPLPRSLSNIFKELYGDLHVLREEGDLSDWAEQGVLLLNAALTVPPGQANAHANIGWAGLIDQILARLDDRPRALVLWGKYAQSRAARVIHPGHLRIKTPHPSPLSARRGFFGSRPFSKINLWLAEHGETPIVWGASDLST